MKTKTLVKLKVMQHARRPANSEMWCMKGTENKYPQLKQIVITNA